MYEKSIPHTAPPNTISNPSKNLHNLNRGEKSLLIKEQAFGTCLSCIACSGRQATQKLLYTNLTYHIHLSSFIANNTEVYESRVQVKVLLTCSLYRLRDSSSLSFANISAMPTFVGGTNPLSPSPSPSPPFAPAKGAIALPLGSGGTPGGGREGGQPLMIQVGARVLLHTAKDTVTGLRHFSFYEVSVDRFEGQGRRQNFVLLLASDHLFRPA